MFGLSMKFLFALCVLCGAFSQADEVTGVVEAALARGDYKRAAECLEHAEKESHLPVRVALADATGQYKEALAMAQQWHASATSVNSLLALSRAYARLGQYQQADGLLRTAVEAPGVSIEVRAEYVRLARILGHSEVEKQQERYGFAQFRRTARDDAVGTTACAVIVLHADPSGAWSALQEAQRADPAYLPAWLSGGAACAEYFSWQFATNCFEQALKLNPHHADAQAGLAAVMMQQNNYAAVEWAVSTALETNPRHVEALVLRAQLEWLGEEYERSLASLEDALQTNPHHPQALNAVAAWYDGRRQYEKRDAAIERALQVNATRPSVYAHLAHAAERRYQFREMEAWGRKALSVTPHDWAANYYTAIGLLRQGEEDEGRELLEASFKQNSFNLWAFNMLNILDKEYDPKQFLLLESEHFAVKMDRKEARILWPYFKQEIEEIWTQYTEKYGLEPTGPKQYNGKILVLIHPTHQFFSARTTGLPGLGALGVCFGQVILMPSPRASNFGTSSFNWREVFLHEFLHVLTLQATEYLVPRWFTEGLSQFEELNAGTANDQLLARGLSTGELLPVEVLNRGLTRAQSGEQFMLSYAYSREICRYLEQEHGFDALLAMLEGYKQRKLTSDMLPHLTGRSLTDLNQGMQGFLRSQIDFEEPEDDSGAFDAAMAKPEEELTAQECAVLAKGFLVSDPAEAKRTVEKGLDLDGDNRELLQLMGILLAEEEPERALALLKRGLDDAPVDYAVDMVAADLAHSAEEPETMIHHLNRAMRARPRCVGRCGGAYIPLATVLQEQEQSHEALDVLERLTHLHTEDARPFMMMGAIYLDQERYQQAAEAFGRAIEVSPYDFEPHKLRLEAATALDDTELIKREATVCLAIQPREPDILAQLAALHLTEGDLREASKMIGRLRRVDPGHAELPVLEARLK